jgi:hypothetical protein
MGFPGIRFLGAALAVCAAASTAFAQDGAITVNTKATSTAIRSWLVSDDPRLVAWGAYFAGENQDRTALAPMIAFVDAWQPPKGDSDKDGNQNKMAMTEVLDALIQLKAQVSPEGVAEVAKAFPEQASILAARLPLDEAAPLLECWYAKREDVKRPVLPRIAAMLLAKGPPEGFAASVLAEAHERYSIMVVDPGVGGGFGGSSLCGTGIKLPTPGWPPLYQYRLEENGSDPEAAPLIEGGGDRVTYRRTQEGGSCRSIEALDDRTRHALLAEMLGVKSDAMSWQPWNREWYAWEGGRGYLLHLGELVDGQETSFRDTVAELEARGFLSPSEAAKVRPTLTVAVRDERGVKEPLPEFETRDPRTKVVDESRPAEEQGEAAAVPANEPQR